MHNGSVPTLVDLLKPPADRPKSFYRGSSHYDEANAGWVSTEPEEDGGLLFEYVTDADGKHPGNGNQGHDHPVADPERGDLIEYLKTL